MRIKIVIPARLASTRLPEKLLLKVGGKSILQHTFESASRAALADGIVVAVDHPRLAAEVASFGGSYLLTSPECQSGTDRVAEVARELKDIDVFINVQGDEPEIDPNAIDLAIEMLLDNPDADISTIAKPIRDQKTLADPNCVKVVLDKRQYAMLFSRAVVPFARDGMTAELIMREPPIYLHHVGIYAYRRDFVLWFASQSPAVTEQVEKLEQLRALEAGRRIVVGRIEQSSVGIDTQEDFEAFRSRYEGTGRSA